MVHHKEASPKKGKQKTPFLRAIRLIFFLLLLAGTSLLAYLHFFGLPGEWKDAALEQLSRFGVHLEIESLHFDIFQGIVARGVKYHLRKENGSWMRLGKIILNVDLHNAIRKRFATESLHVEGSNLEFCPGKDKPTLSISRAKGNLRFTTDKQLYLENLTGEMLGLQVTINGRLDLQRPPPPRPPSASPGMDYDRIRTWLQKLSDVKLTSPIRLDLQFNGSLGNPQSYQVKARIQGQQVAYENWHADQVRGEIRYSGGMLSLSELFVSSQGGAGTLYGFWNPQARQAQFELVSNLDPNTLFGKDPESRPRFLKDWEFGVRPECWIKGSIDFSLPNPLMHLNADCSFWLRETAWGPHPIREAKGNAQIIDGRLILPNLLIRQENTRLTGNVEFSFPTQTLIFDVANTIDLAEIMTLLYPGEKNWFRQVHFQKPSLLKLTGHWRIRDPHGLQAQGEMNWHDWSAGGVNIESTKAQIHIDGRKFQFRELCLKRPEGEINGDFSLDFDRQNAHLNAISTIDFASLTRIVGPKTEEMFKPYHFITPPRITFKGCMHFGDESLSDLWTHVECDQFQVWRFKASKVSGYVHSYKKSLEIARYESEFYGGRLTGDAVFDFSRPEGDWVFHSDIQQADFDKLTHDIWEFNEVKGFMTGWADISGCFDSSRELRGRGSATIRDGVLWRIPLLGELSKFLPFLAEHKATKAYAHFTIGNQKVNIYDMKVSAGLMSLTAKGDYRFDQTVDFIVQGHFLRGLLGVGYVFDPFTKAFEYHLTGKLNDRKWKPRFLPKELLFQFGDDNPPPSAKDEKND
ncbi:MAG: hypothetical protein PHV34_14530 [Verrucomicrobiae bacterium]|nr:hypothetical protein [Verrucomicrobiae bacterium]